MIDPSLIEDILKQADIVDVISSYINVIKKGRNFVAVCPFHDDKNPSMMISRDKQIFKCFVCGTGGNAITFVQNFEKISYIEAVKKVAEIINYHDERLEAFHQKKVINPSLEPLYKCINDLVSYYEYGLTTEEGTKAYEYLINRHIDDKIQQDFHIGYAFGDGTKSIEFLKAKGHSLKSIESIGIASSGSRIYDQNAGRVIFPITNSDGQVVGFSARRLDDNEDKPKYVNSPETELFKKNNILFNYHNAKAVAKRDKYVYVLEGFMDVIALRKAGILSAVALMGTAFTSNHIKLLRALGVEVRMCLDGDAAGQMATLKCCKMLDLEGIPYKVVSSNGDKRDPDEILNQEGKEALISYLNRLVDKVDFMFQYYKTTKSLSSFDEKNKFITSLLPVILKLTNRLEVENYLLNLAKITGFDIAVIRDIYKDAKSKQTSTKEFNFNDYTIENNALKKYVLAEREIVYQMLNNNDAVEYFENNVEYFYDEVYQKIANYIIELYETAGKVDKNMLISLFDQNEEDNNQTLRNKVIEILLEKHHPPYSTNLMNDCKEALSSEQEKYKSRLLLDEALKGKDPLEQARLIDEYFKQKKK